MIIVATEKPTFLIVSGKKKLIKYKHFVNVNGIIVHLTSMFTGTDINNSLFNLN